MHGARAPRLSTVYFSSHFRVAQTLAYWTPYGCLSSKNERIIFRIFWDISCAVHCHCLNVHERHDIFVCHP